MPGGRHKKNYERIYPGRVETSIHNTYMKDEHKPPSCTVLVLVQYFQSRSLIQSKRNVSLVENMFHTSMYKLRVKSVWIKDTSQNMSSSINISKF